MLKELMAFFRIIKMSKESARYTDKAPTINDCSLCLDYLPSLSRCTTVAGRISPNGWCKRFTAKSSWEGDRL